MGKIVNINDLKSLKKSFSTEGNLALKPSVESKEKEYNNPKVKKLAFSKTDSKIVMGCWQQNYTSNGGDGC